MSGPTPAIYLVRHGATEWALNGRHTGLTDIPLLEQGERDARGMGERLAGLGTTFSTVLTSPLQRAHRTCELAGFGAVAVVDHDLVEWDYGAYEGLRSVEIRQRAPDWSLFRDGCPDGESVAEVGARADRVLARLRAVDGVGLVFSSGHFLRVLAARWLGLEPAAGRVLALRTASLSVLGYEHGHVDPVLMLWNG